VVAAFGESKRQALSVALSQPDSAMPLAMVMREKSRVLLLLDPEAASGIRLKNR
jgi:6-phosphogluconolactonase/glucosamine-6-phosphate isomerase/deaminase